MTRVLFIYIFSLKPIYAILITWTGNWPDNSHKHCLHFAFVLTVFFLFKNVNKMNKGDHDYNIG